MSAGKEPRVGIIALVPDTWCHETWALRHQILTRLAGHFEVVWIEPSLGWRDHWLKGRGRAAGTEQVLAAVPSFSVFSPGRWLPEVFKPRAFGNWLRRRRVIAARRFLERRGCDRIVLYIWRPEFAWAVGAIPADLTCYHIDDEYQFSTTPAPEDPQEIGLIRAAGQVIIHSPRLLERKGRINPNTAFVPNGVDYRAYVAPTREPQDLAAIPRPRMGYVGVVKAQLDLALHLELAQRNPGWSFVFVGPQGYLGDKQHLIAKLGSLPNVHLLGGRKVTELPHYTQHLDVCLMSYEVNDYTNCIYPLKLHEYLASGRPVVSAPIESVLPFGKVVRLASSLEEWERSLALCLEPQASSHEAVAERRAVAADHDWDALVSRIARLFRQQLRLEA
jgi:glycosyltransferase involved in cell wall biosynthesis